MKMNNKKREVVVVPGSGKKIIQNIQNIKK